MDRTPEDCEKDPVTRTEGVAQKYVLLTPGEHWYLRKSEATKKYNAAVDRWIIRPDKDACIFVIVEEVPDGVIDLDKYTDAVVAAIEAETSSLLISREAVKSRPDRGRILRAKATVDGARVDYLYGLFAEGSHAYQVVALARNGTFAELEADFRRTIEQFELPRNAHP
jgi:hypothetical protein